MWHFYLHNFQLIKFCRIVIFILIYSKANFWKKFILLIYIILFWFFKMANDYYTLISSKMRIVWMLYDYRSSRITPVINFIFNLRKKQKKQCQIVWTFRSCGMFAWCFYNFVVNLSHNSNNWYWELAVEDISSSSSWLVSLIFTIQNGPVINFIFNLRKKKKIHNVRWF